MIPCVNDYAEVQDVTTLNISDAFMQAESDVLVDMHLKLLMAEILVKLDHKLYQIMWVLKRVNMCHLWTLQCHYM